MSTPDLAARFDQLVEEALPACPVGRMLAAFDPATAEAVGRALATQFISTTRLKREFDQVGYRIGRLTIQAHRDGECRCSQ